MWDARTGADRGQLRLPSLREEASRLGLLFEETNQPWWISFRPIIRSLLLYQDQLVVMVSMYGNLLRELLDHDPLLQFYLSTRILVYKTSAVTSGGTLTLMFQQDINGDYKKAQRIKSNIHIVTMSRVKNQKLFDEPLDRQNFGTITSKEYITQMRRLAETLLIPAYVRGLTKELSVNGSLPNIARMSIMQTEWNASHFNPQLYKYGLSNFYVQVSSLDLTLPMTTEPSAVNMIMNMTGVFVPFTRANVYSAVDILILATLAYDYVPDTMDYRQFTYLIAWGLNESSANMRAVGRVPGSLLNEYAVDVVGDVVRIGTTVQDPQWCCIPYPNVTDMINGTTTTANSLLFGVTTNYANTMSPTRNSKSSNTKNFITTLRIPALVEALSSLASPGVMKTIGQLGLGNENEEFASLRFFDNIAYAVTQKIVNPSYYVLDLSDPTDLQILGKLNTSGDEFSGYLYSMNDNNTLLLGISDAVKERKDGFLNFFGLQISVLDARNPAQLMVAQHYLIEENSTFDDVRTSAMSDFHSVRYDPHTQRLILPVSLQSFKDSSLDYYGFYVFIVNENEITPTCSIDIKANASHNDCFYCAGIPYRSMIFHGNIMTVAAHFVQSTNLKSCTSEWNFAVSPPIDLDQMCCDAIFSFEM
jgi:hypothetical protein